MAGRPRLPQEVAKVTGAIAKNPQMFRGRSNPKVKSLGPAPKRFTDEQRAIWDEINADFPWLGRSDRELVCLAVVLKSQIEAEPMAATAAQIGQMRLLLSSMGGTPVDRSKVQAPEDDEPDPTDEFLQ